MEAICVPLALEFENGTENPFGDFFLLLLHLYLDDVNSFLLQCVGKSARTYFSMALVI